jgi:glyoxalase family protein
VKPLHTEEHPRGYPLLGIHHVTALAGDPQNNADFYTKVLGLRLVKKTVNFDAPDVYHLYYGDKIGRPGTILTFFPFPNAARGKRGVGEIEAVSLTVPVSSMGFWAEHLSRHGVAFGGPARRFNEDVFSFQDPDGMRLELVFTEGAQGRSHWSGSPIPGDSAVRGISGVTLMLADHEKTARLLVGTMGFTLLETRGDRSRYVIGEGHGRASLDIMTQPTLPPSRQSAGSVHHIAWRVATDEGQRAWQETIAQVNIPVTDILDRNYFQSIYFREPGGVLFEIATDTPGFTIDEPADGLGSHLQLPHWLEPDRKSIERTLPPIVLPL